ncbi:MAG: ECF transporter S component [Erysipelotrichaceae bacterium]|nr:ECF transporter S component [Erysipelotrichaceae bacterium]
MNIKTITRTGILIAMMFVLTAVVSIPMGFGYINLSDALIMILGGLEQMLPLTLMASIGTCLADLYLGYANYAVFTFLVKGLEALIIFGLFKQVKHKYGYIFIYLIGALTMLIGYGLADIIIASNIDMFIPSIIANLPQAVSCLVIACVIYPIIKKVYRY